MTTVDIPFERFDSPAAPARPRPLLPTWLWAPYALYAVSAACILVGIAQILIPVNDNPVLDPQKFYCLITLNLYEVALLGVALTIILWRRVYDDAVALTLLIAVFMLASAVALDTVAPAYPRAVGAFGVGGLMLAAGKLMALQQHVIGRLGRWTLAGLGIVLTVALLMPATLGELKGRDIDPATLRMIWFGGWWLSVFGSALIVIGAGRVPTGDAGAGEVGEPFLRTAAMRWIVVGVVLAGAAAQQYALTWAFDLRVAVGDLLPAVGVAALLVLEITRGYGYRFAWVEAAVCALPMAAMLLAVVFNRYTAVPSDPAAALSFGPLFAAAFALAMHVSAWRGGQPSRHGAGALYLLTAVLLFGVRPDVAFEPAALSWVGFGYWLAAVLMVWAIVRRKAGPAFASAVALATTIALDPIVRQWAADVRLEAPAIGAAAFGLVSLGVYAVARRRVPQWAGFFAAAVLSAAVMHCCLRDTALHAPYIASAATLGVVAACAGWRRECWPMLPGAAPLAVAFYMDVEQKGWAFVAASFVILLIGAVGSVRKGGAGRADSSVTT